MRSTIRPFQFGFVAAFGAFAFVLAACSSSGTSSAPSAAPSAAAATGGGAAAIATGSGAVGAYLTGAGGKTLYIFTPDAAGKSTCVDKCAATWPPFTVTGGAPAAGAGVTGSLTTLARPDGTTQVAINGMPLYYYAADTKAGDTTGEGVGGKWFVARPDGALPSAAPSSSTRY